MHLLGHILMGPFCFLFNFVFAHLLRCCQCTLNSLLSCDVYRKSAYRAQQQAAYKRAMQAEEVRRQQQHAAKTSGETTK